MIAVAAHSPANADAWRDVENPITTPVYLMSHPGYDPPGYELGSFALNSSLSETTAYDDNIFASDIHKADDLVETLNEDFDFASQWSQHSVSGRGYFAQQFYGDHPFENADTYGVESTGHFDISSTAFLRLDGSFEQQPQARDSPEADVTAVLRPIFNTADGTLSFVKDFGRVEELAQAEVTKISYIDNIDASRSATGLRYRDRVSVHLTGDFTLFAQGSYTIQNWLLKGPLRDYDVTTGLAGFDAQISGVLDAELGIGVSGQDFRNPEFNAFVAPTASGHLTWNVLLLTTLNASIDRTVRGTETFCDPAHNGSVYDGVPIDIASLRGTLELTSAGIGIQHEFWHNLLGEARFRYERDRFDLVDLIDNNYSADVNFRYLISPNFELDASAIHNIRTANKPTILIYNTGPYTENRLSLTLKAAI